MSQAMSGVCLVIFLFYMILGFVVYHKCFNVIYINLMKALKEEIIGCAIFAFIATWITVYFWPIAAIAIVTAGFSLASKVKNPSAKNIIIVVSVIFAIAVSVVSHKLKQEADGGKHKDTPTTTIQYQEPSTSSDDSTPAAESQSNEDNSSDNNSAVENKTNEENSAAETSKDNSSSTTVNQDSNSQASDIGDNMTLTYSGDGFFNQAVWEENDELSAIACSYEENNEVKKAKSIAETAVHLDAESQLYLGRCYFEGNGVKKNKKLGRVYLQMASEAGLTTDVMRFYIQKANQGDCDAKIGLGWYFYYGDGVKKDYDKSIALFKQAYEQSKTSDYLDGNVCYILGEHYHDSRSEFNAVGAWEMASELGCYEDPMFKKEELFFKIAQGYENTYDGGKFINSRYSLEQAVSYFIKAANLGNIEAMSRLGCLLYNKFEDKKSALEAFSLMSQTGSAEGKVMQRQIYDYEKCVSNLKELAAACELYRNSNGNYPYNLSALTPTYISNNMLTCPTNDSQYSISYDNNSYKIKCNGNHEKLRRGRPFCTITN